MINQGMRALLQCGRVMVFPARRYLNAPADSLATAPQVVALEPKRVEVEEGKAYFWCACGFTKNEPWCDGSHKAASTIRPVKWVAPKSGIANICACRHTKRPGRVLCDGGHVHLPLKQG